MKSTSSLEQKIDTLLAFLRDSHLALAHHQEILEKSFDALVDEVRTLDRNLETFYKNAEQRFDAMHLEHDLIIDMLARIHGIDGRQGKKND